MVNYKTQREIDDNDLLIIEFIDGWIDSKTIHTWYYITFIFFNNLFRFANYCTNYKFYLTVEETAICPNETINYQILCHFLMNILIYWFDSFIKWRNIFLQKYPLYSNNSNFHLKNKNVIMIRITITKKLKFYMCCLLVKSSCLVFDSY